MKRLSINDALMQTAKIWSQRGTCNRKSVGAVIARDTRIISTGYVGSPPGLPHCTDAGCLIDPHTGGCVRTLHAETNAIAFAAAKGLSVERTSLYVTLSPCVSCSKLIVASRISEVYYNEAYRDSSGLDYLLMGGVSVLQIK